MDGSGTARVVMEAVRSVSWTARWVIEATGEWRGHELLE